MYFAISMLMASSNLFKEPILPDQISDLPSKGACLGFWFEAVFNKVLSWPLGGKDRHFLPIVLHNGLPSHKPFLLIKFL